MRFLSALRSAMLRERRATSRPVILLGDLNLKARPLMDRHWSNCYINLNRLASLGAPSPPAAELHAAWVGATKAARTALAEAT